MKKIYSLDSKNKTRVWFCEQNENQFRVHSGILDGKIVISEWTTCRGKNIGRSNQTTDVEQCSLEIIAKYAKQLKSGYFESIEDIGKDLFVEPMLAKKYSDYKSRIDFTKGEYLAQCKFNGMRCIITKDGMFTRTGEPIHSAPHILEDLTSFFQSNPDFVLDGELFNEDLREQLNELMKIVRKTVNITDEELTISKEMVKYYIYDGYDSDTKDYQKSTPYISRKGFIDSFVLDNNLKSIEFVKTIQITSEQQFLDFYNSLIEDNHEGAMLRLKNSGYENKRSKNLLKFKPVDDAEFEFCGVQEGKGNWSNMVKIINLKMSDGRTFDGTFKGSQVEAREFLNNYQHLIGKQVRVFYNGFTGLGVPNYAQFDCKNYMV